MPIQALIFDLDGTLIDSAPDLRTACNKVLSKHGRRDITMEETTQFIGNGAAKLIERAFRATGDEVDAETVQSLMKEFLAFYDGHEADETTPYEGVMETLAELKAQNYRMALCTNKPTQPTHNLLSVLGMEEFFELVIGGDKLSSKKPNPEMIHWVLEQMKVEPSQAIMIGDSPNDVQGARNAGIKNIAVSYGYRKVTLEEMGADQVVHRFDEIPALVSIA